MKCSKWMLVVLLCVAGGGCTQRVETASDDWWRNAVIYEIYPRSFADSNGDGIGDLRGITQHLDYLKELGVDALWITPVYPSPQVDFGYDIMDYGAIDPQYGTMADFDLLVTEAKQRGLRVITDLVLNHTSDRHPWFVESSSSRNNPKADWYVWHDPKAGGGVPNNWQSVFGRSAWEWNASRNQYYYHQFYRQQPDLNWHNPDVRKAMYDVMRFWMKRGVDGFRLDAITSLFEDAQLRDETESGERNAFGDRVVSREYTDNLPDVHEVLRELRAVTNERPGRVLVGETYVPGIGELRKMYGSGNDELHLPMDLQLLLAKKLSALEFRDRLRDAATQLNGNPPLFVFDNHDNPRSWTRYGHGARDLDIAKLIATLLLTPRGAALLYYGQELGMPNTDPQRKEDVRDPVGIAGWPVHKGRDGERTPMQWDGGANAGFSSAAATWLPVSPCYRERNVAIERKDVASLFCYYRRLLELRKQQPALRDGQFVLVNESDANVLCYMRRLHNGSVAVALNFSKDPQLVHSWPGATKAVTLISSAFLDGQAIDLNHLELPPYGSWVGKLQ